MDQPIFPSGNIQDLESFLYRRQAKQQALQVLRFAKDKFNLDRTQISSASNLTYQKITESLQKCLDNKWITKNDLCKLLDSIEISGRQHIILFDVPPTLSQKVWDLILSPDGGWQSEPAELSEFIETPDQSTIRILLQSAREIIVKIIGIRSYWDSTFEIDTSEEQLIRRKKLRERSAVILNYNLDENRLQVRIPVKEQGSLETGTSVHAYAVESLSRHYDMSRDSWFYQLTPFPIREAFPKIAADRFEFILKYDTPEDHSVASTISKKGAMSDEIDLRDDPNWNHEKGYARRSIRGYWRCDDGLVFMHLNSDTAHLDKKTDREIARIFVPRVCADRGLDDAIRKVYDHL